MSTAINTNTTAFMAADNLTMNTNNLSTDIQRLSTGLQINSAADNPAGLVISEDMQAQVTGLSQATSNSNDAINMIKTAEGALNQVQNLLISMRQLAVHASNLGVNDTTAVQADQTQIASAIESINRISSTTQFANKNLLDGSATSGLTTTAGSASASAGGQFAIVASGTWSTGNAYSYTQNSLSTTSAATDSFATTKVGPVATAVTMTSANTTFGGSITINGNQYNLTGSTPATLTAFNTAIAASGYQATINGSGNLVFNAQASGPTTQPTINASSLVISGATSSIASTGADATTTSTFATAAGTGGTLTKSVAAVVATTPISVSGTLQLQSASGTTFTKTYAPGTSLYQVQQDLNSTFGTGPDAVTASTNAAGSLVFTDTTNNLTSTGSSFSAYNSVTPPTVSTFTNGTLASMTLSDGTHTLTSTSTQITNGQSYYSFGNGLVLSSGVAASTTSTTSLNGSLQTVAGATTAGTNLEFQIGANGGQTASESIQSIAANQLGTGAPSYTDANGTTQTVLTGSVADVNVTSFKGAQDAIAVLDQAINQISTLRANLGAFQTNVLQSNVTSLGVAQSNLSSSLSTIRDADLATTVTDYTKNQILVQASTSALSYANQMPQALLKLLQ